MDITLKFKCNGTTYALSVAPQTILAEMKAILVNKYEVPVATASLSSVRRKLWII